MELLAVSMSDVLMVKKANDIPFSNRSDLKKLLSYIKYPFIKSYLITS